ncbi:MAG: hypothetical protein ABIX01_03615 [Chitinophagaceae bacterium]
MPVQNKDGITKDLIASRKIRTTMKDQDRFYKDYILSIGACFQPLIFSCSLSWGAA